MQQESDNQMRQASDLSIGLFGVIALGMLLFAWFWYRNEPLWLPPQRFKVLFHDVDGLTEHAAVKINGVRVGAVDRLTLTGPDEVIADVKIRHAVKVPQGAEFEITGDGLIGARVLQITLPKLSADSQPVFLDEHSIVRGKDPTYPERDFYKIASNLSRVDFSGLESRLVTGAERLAIAADEAAGLARQTEPILRRSAAQMDAASQEAARLARSARPTLLQAELALSSARVAADQAGRAAAGVESLTLDLQTTSKNIGKVFEDSALSGDIKQIVEDARHISASLEKAACHVSAALKDPNLRQDLLQGLEKVKESTANIRSSVAGVENLAANLPQSEDITGIIADVRKTMAAISRLVEDADFTGDAKCTLAKVRTMADRIDQVGEQLHQILDKRAPALQLMIGRPGRVKGPGRLEKECLPMPKLTERSQTGAVIIDGRGVDAAGPKSAGAVKPRP